MKLPTYLSVNILPILLVGLVTVVFLAMYCSIQHVYRQAANDPQVQMAEDAVASLAKGVPLAEVVPLSAISINESLSPFLNVYDQIGTPVTGSGKLHDALPKIPGGVFEHALKKDDYRLTWQPENGVRSALVVKSYKTDTGDKGFVVAGRSLRETEHRIAVMSGCLLVAWVLSVGLVVAYWFFRPAHKAVE